VELDLASVVLRGRREASRPVEEARVIVSRGVEFWLTVVEDNQLVT
jgi:hypothetical protein